MSAEQYRSDKELIRYDIEITGHASPFKWQVFRIGLDGLEYPLASGETYGEIFEARDDAAEAIENDIWEREHRSTKRRFPFCSVEPTEPELERKERDANVVNFGLAGKGKDQWQKNAA